MTDTPKAEEQWLDSVLEKMHLNGRKDSTGYGRHLDEAKASIQSHYKSLMEEVVKEAVGEHNHLCPAHNDNDLSHCACTNRELRQRLARLLGDRDE